MQKRKTFGYAKLKEMIEEREIALALGYGEKNWGVEKDEESEIEEEKSTTTTTTTTTQYGICWRWFARSHFVGYYRNARTRTPNKLVVSNKLRFNEFKFNQ